MVHFLDGSGLLIVGSAVPGLVVLNALRKPAKKRQSAPPGEAHLVGTKGKEPELLNPFHTNSPPMYRKEIKDPRARHFPFLKKAFLYWTEVGGDMDLLRVLRKRLSSGPIPKQCSENFSEDEVERM